MYYVYTKSTVRVQDSVQSTLSPPKSPINQFLSKGPDFTMKMDILSCSLLLCEARMAGDLNTTSVSKQIIRKPNDDSRKLLCVYHTDTLESSKANKTLDRRPRSKEILLYLCAVPTRSRKKWIHKIPCSSWNLPKRKHAVHFRHECPEGMWSRQMLK